MFNSKYYLVVIVIAFLFLAGAVGLQVLEMKDYNLFNSLSNRFFKKTVSTTTEAPAAAATAPATKRVERKAETAAAAPATAATPATAEKK